MVKNFTLAETRKMSESKIQTEIGKCVKQIDELGMDHNEVCALVSSIINLGIALREKWNQNRKFK